MTISSLTGGSAFTGIPDGCDLVTVQVPTGATFAHSTNRKIVLEFEGVCDKLLDTDLKVPRKSTNGPRPFTSGFMENSTQEMFC